jgi:hypothetical protein
MLTQILAAREGARNPLSNPPIPPAHQWVETWRIREVANASHISQCDGGWRSGCHALRGYGNRRQQLNHHRHQQGQGERERVALFQRLEGGRKVRQRRQ